MKSPFTKVYVKYLGHFAFLNLGNCPLKTFSYNQNKKYFYKINNNFNVAVRFLITVQSPTALETDYSM